MINTELVKVSVIMPVYNAEAYLVPAIDSVLDQTLKEIELICIDDGSTDRSLDIIKQYNKNDPRVRILTENNAGPSMARNKGIVRARGEYIVFLDADDFSDITMLEDMYLRAKREELDVVISDYDIYNDKRARFVSAPTVEYGKIFEECVVVSKNTYPDHILQCTTTYVWNKMWRRVFLVEKELAFDEKLRLFEDVLFVATALSMADRIGKVNKVLTHHRVYSDQHKNKLFRTAYMNMPEICSKIKEFMRQHGTYAPLSQSFLNFSVSKCRDVYHRLSRDARADFWMYLHDIYADELGWIDGSPDEFDNDNLCDFCANVIMYNYTQYESRQKRGLRIRLSSVGPAIKANRNRKRIKKFFIRLFKRKKNEEK